MPALKKLIPLAARRLFSIGNEHWERLSLRQFNTPNHYRDIFGHLSLKNSPYRRSGRSTTVSDENYIEPIEAMKIAREYFPKTALQIIPYCPDFVTEDSAAVCFHQKVWKAPLSKHSAGLMNSPEPSTND